VVRYTQEVAEYAERLQEVDERTRDAPLDVVEWRLERVRASMDSAPVRTSQRGTRIRFRALLLIGGVSEVELAQIQRLRAHALLNNPRYASKPRLPWAPPIKPRGGTPLYHPLAYGDDRVTMSWLANGLLRPLAATARASVGVRSERAHVGKGCPSGRGWRLGRPDSAGALRLLAADFVTYEYVP
jgi:hypothetical protein